MRAYARIGNHTVGRVCQRFWRSTFCVDTRQQYEIKTRPVAHAAIWVGGIHLYLRSSGDQIGTLDDLALLGANEIDKVIADLRREFRWVLFVLRLRPCCQQRGQPKRRPQDHSTGAIIRAFRVATHISRRSFSLTKAMRNGVACPAASHEKRRQRGQDASGMRESGTINQVHLPRRRTDPEARICATVATVGAIVGRTFKRRRPLAALPLRTAPTASARSRPQRPAARLPALRPYKSPKPRTSVPACSMDQQRPSKVRAPLRASFTYCRRLRPPARQRHHLLSATTAFRARRKGTSPQQTLSPVHDHKRGVPQSQPLHPHVDS